MTSPFKKPALACHPSCHRYNANPDVAVREIDVEVKRQVGLAYSAVRPASDVLQNFIAKLGQQRPKVTRVKPVARIKR